MTTTNRWSKSRKLALGLGSVLALTAALTGSVYATASPPQNVTVPVSFNGCTVLLAHGNAFGGAYAHVTYTSESSGCGNLSFAQVTGWNGNFVLGNKCFITRTDLCPPNHIDASGIQFQSFAGSSNLLATTISFCNLSNNCVNVSFSGI